MEARTCLNCGEALKGRIDKKFCDDQCRTQHNNRLNSESSALVRNINLILKKNRRILETTIAGAANGVATTSGKKLQEKGFNFNYHTSTYKTKKGDTYFFCYEFGYLPLESDKYTVVRKQVD